MFPRYLTNMADTENYNSAASTTSTSPSLSIAQSVTKMEKKGGKKRKKKKKKFSCEALASSEIGNGQ